MEIKFSPNVDFLIDIQQWLHINDVLDINGMPIVQVDEYRAFSFVPSRHACAK